MRKLIFSFFCLVFVQSYAQDLNYVRGVIKDLCSPEFYGRGYVKEGDKKAALYIRDAMKTAKLKSLGTDFFQEFGYPVVTFGREISVEVDKHELVPGEHFIVSPGCPPFSGTFDLVWVDSAMIDNQSMFQALQKRNLRNSFIVVTQLKTQNLINKDKVALVLGNKLNAKGIIYAAEKKLTWSVATSYDKFPQLYVLDGWLKPY